MPEVLKAPSRESFATEYSELRPRLESRFRKWFPSLRGQEGDFYNEAWESLLQAGTEPDSIAAWLERALYSRGLNELRRRERRPGDQAGPDESMTIERVVDRTEPGTEEHVVAELGAAASQQVLLERLSPRQARIIKLHYGWGLTVAEVASALSVSKRTVRREVEDAAPKVIENAEWLTRCTDGGRRSLVRAYVLGFLSDTRAAKAATHLEVCPSCSALRDQMQEALRGVAAAVPAGVVAEPPGAGDSMLARVVEAAEGARAQLADLGGSAKQQAAAMVGRAPGGDTAAQVAAGGGLRGSGTMLATAASCLVVGGGTVTYCAVEGVPGPVRDVLPGQRDAKPKLDTTPVKAEETAPAPVHPAPPVVPTQTQPTPPPPAPPAEQQAPAPSSDPTPPAEREFGIEDTASPEPSGSTATATPSTAPPPPAPSGGGEEFGFER